MSSNVFGALDAEKVVDRSLKSHLYFPGFIREAVSVQRFNFMRRTGFESFAFTYRFSFGEGRRGRTCALKVESD